MKIKWYAISGSWRIINNGIKKDLEDIVKEIIFKGDSIITGGALGVDYIATQVVLDYGNVKKQLKIYLPIKLDDFCIHFFKRVDEGIITKEQAEMITIQLNEVKRISPKSIFDDTGYNKANVESYYARNTSIIRNCDELYAFQVNESKGTQDAINKARKLGKKVMVKKYTIKLD